MRGPGNFCWYASLLLFLKEPVRFLVFSLFKLGSDKANSVLPNVIGSQEPTAAAVPEPADNNKLLPLHSALTRRVIIAVGNYTSPLMIILAAFTSIQPLFLSTPRIWWSKLTIFNYGVNIFRPRNSTWSV